ncbi:MAG: hypothetical protein OXS40_14140 [Gammaproteobacteria bacterium]|nr:hypothetical protein [Gammaproteobacteria bacterium]
MNHPRNLYGRHIPLAGILAAATLLIAGCGGGGGSGENQARQYRQPDTGGAAGITGSQAPAESAADQGVRAPGILGRADSVIASTVFGRTDSPLLPSVQAPATCSGAGCSVSVPEIGFSYEIDLRDLTASTADVDAVLTRNGVTTLYYGDDGDGDGEYDTRLYGSWMHHGAFVVGTLTGELSGTSVTGSAGLSGGDLTGSSPSVNAAWKGIMVGAPQGGTDILQGDAELVYTMGDGGGTLDASFTGIVNLDEAAAHSVARVSFMDVPVGSDGTYDAGIPESRIRGGFHGPDHAETAGVFEKSGIVGAFGALREE